MNAIVMSLVILIPIVVARALVYSVEKFSNVEFNVDESFWIVNGYTLKIIITGKIFKILFNDIEKILRNIKIGFIMK